MAAKLLKIDKVVSLQLGQNFENLGTTIQFDMSDWMAAYPNASLFILVKRPFDDYASPVSSTFDAETKILTWTVGMWETSVLGIAKAEVRAVNPDTGLLAKSRVIPCSIEETIDPELVIPDPYEQWLDKLTGLAAETEVNAQRSEIAAAIAEGASGGILMLNIEDDGHLWFTFTEALPYRFELENGRLIAYESE